MTIEAGFELEFLSNLPHKDIVSGLKKLFPIQCRTRKSRFHVDVDSSVKSNRNVEYSHEIITPVWELKTGISNLEILFSYLDIINAEVNSTCGLHINLGFSDPEKTKSIDPLSVVMLTDTEKWLKTFRRSSSSFCIAFSKRYRSGDFYTLSDLKHELKQGRCHYDAISLLPLEEAKGKGYVEFRMLGNTNYHRRFPVVKQAVMEFANVLKDSAAGRKKKLVLERSARYLR